MKTENNNIVITISNKKYCISLNDEFFGLIGKGFSKSFYKLYIKPSNSSKWIKFEHDFELCNSNPIKDQLLIQVEFRASSVIGKVSDLNKFECIDRNAIMSVMNLIKGLQ